MNKEQINAINENARLVRLYEAQHRLTMDDLQRDYLRLTADCDHKHPDGNSAIEDMIMWDACTICHASNL